MQVDKHGPSVLLPQTIFIANDWPTGLLPLQLLALQRKRSASAPLNDNPVQQAHSSALALIASPAVGAGTADPAGDSHLHSDVAVPVQLAAFHRLNQLPDATPDDPEWQDAHCTLQAILQDSLVSAKVRPSHKRCYTVLCMRAGSVPTAVLHQTPDSSNLSHMQLRGVPLAQYAGRHVHSQYRIPRRFLRGISRFP